MALHFQVSALCAADPRPAAPGIRRDAGVWRLRAESGDGGRGAAGRCVGALGPVPGQGPGTGLGCPPQARARGRGGPSSGMAGGGAGARLEVAPRERGADAEDRPRGSPPSRVPPHGAHRGSAAPEQVGDRQYRSAFPPRLRPRLHRQPPHSSEGAREGPGSAKGAALHLDLNWLESAGALFVGS